MKIPYPVIGLILFLKRNPKTTVFCKLQCISIISKFSITKFHRNEYSLFGRIFCLTNNVFRLNFNRMKFIYTSEVKRWSRILPQMICKRMMSGFELAWHLTWQASSLVADLPDSFHSVQPPQPVSLIGKQKSVRGLESKWNSESIDFSLYLFGRC